MHMILRRLRDDIGGAVIIEFAYCMPIFMGLGVTGIELSNMATANMKVSQITMTVADNLSRAKQDVALSLPQFREQDVLDAFKGAQLQSGTMNVLNNGRIIVSSLQQNASGGQWIAWQRCKGVSNVVSSYGVQDTGKTGTAFAGMGAGTAAQKVTAPAGSAIIFVEVTYTYQPIVSNALLGAKTMRKEAAFYVRDDRDLTKVWNPSPSVTPATCDLFNAT